MEDRRRIGRPSPSMVVALVALFVAVGLGTAYALERNSVKSKHLKDGGIKSIDVGDDQLTGDDVKESTLSLSGGGSGTQGPQGLQGPKGDKGDTGERGPIGPQGPAGSARAYGLVSDIGSTTRTKNVVNVSNPGVPVGVFCIALDASIDPATAVMIVGPDDAFASTDYTTQDVSVVEWDSTNDFCGAGEFEVQTGVYFGDELDNDSDFDADADTIGDDLVEDDEGFAFMVP